MIIIGIRTLILSLFLTGCLPEQEVRTDVSNNSINNSTNNTNTTTTDDSSDSSTGRFTESVNFFQQNGDRTTATLSLASNYQDSYLVRGNDMFDFLTDVAETYDENFCVVSFFPTVSGSTSNSVLITSARVRSFYSSFLNTRELFLQIEPNNETINQNDCLTVALTSKLESVFDTTDFAFSIDDVCPDCVSGYTSRSLRLFDIYGVERSPALIGHLNLNLSPAIGSVGTTSPVCSNNSSCTSVGFNCCLEGQCVNHGQVRPEVNTSSDNYIIALEILEDRPELINNFGDIFYDQ